MPYAVLQWKSRMAQLIIVSNRLPVSVKKEGGKLVVYPSSGGLATGLSGYTKRAGTKWIGWPGLPSDDLSKRDEVEIAKLLKPYRCYPLFLTKKQIDAYYNGYSNGVLWPLFHELPIKAGNTKRNWEAYHEINNLFAQETLHLSSPGSTIWVHDYQLLLVPGMLRAERPGDHIGFFLHIPFPSAEHFGHHTHARALLGGMLGADLLGFHTSGYTTNFLEACETLEVGTRSANHILLAARAVRATEFPMGIDYEKFAEASRKRTVQSEYKKLQRKYAGLKVIATVDRLDPTKGFIERLTAYQELLGNNPNLRGRVVMVMLAIPSRQDIPEYQKLRRDVETLIDTINDTYGTNRWQPIEYLYQTLNFAELAALYQRADVAFVTPVRDGMNLVAKEYIASQPDRKGMLVLSQTAGAAEELKDAIQVDPRRPKTLVSGLTKALTLPTRELQKRTGKMQRHLQKFTVQNWADTFMDTLQKPRTIKQLSTRTLDAKAQAELGDAYRHAGRRLILLDYDGTLQPFVTDPAKAIPSPRLLKLLRKFGENPKNDLMIISGRSKRDLEERFGALPIALAAEHGAVIRRKNGKHWHKATSTEQSWKEIVVGLFDYYTQLTPGAATEQKEWSVAWHYRGAKPYASQKYLVALRRLLKPVLSRYDLQLLEGNKVLEVRPADINKRRAAQEWLIHDHDFMLCIGDDTTDEDMFAAMPPHAYSVKVGRGQTTARFRLPNIDAVLRLLGSL